jgi:type I restriction enzyme, R subunit
MNYFTEDVLEQSCIEIFESLGYEYRFGPDLAPDGLSAERANYLDVVLKDRLFVNLNKINAGMPAEAINEAVKKVLHLDSPSMLINNKTFHKYITDGIDVSFRENGAEKHKKVYLFDTADIDNNNFLVVNQFTVIEKHDRRPDLVVFINGIPVSVIELKSASDEEATIEKAYNQIKTYQNDIPALFHYNAFSIISDGINAKAGTVTSNQEWFKMWRTDDGVKIAPVAVPQYDTLIRGIFVKERIIDILRSSILFQADDKDSYVKIMTGYHQYFAVRKAIERTKEAISEHGDRKIGVIWHTQGSGKSLLMVFYAGGLIRELDNPTLVFITDRNDLDQQLFNTFSKSADILRQTPIQANSRKTLREMLDRESGGVLFTTIQKFTPDEDEDIMPVLCTRTNVIVIADEAHRSQYGLKSRTSEAGEIKYGYAKYMREAMPNASFIGFTGTPIEFEDKSTPAVFGNYIDIYDMTRAVEDKSTVKIYYENRIIKLNLDDSISMDDLDDEIDELTEGHEEYTRNKLKSKWGRLEAVVGADARVKQLALDIVDHFETRQKSMFGKAMIVCMSRRICIDLYKEITALNPDWHSEDKKKGKIKIVMTGSASDPQEWQKHVGNKPDREDLAKRFKDVKDELKLVIVRDMWLTGFDVPSLNAIYIDKPMKGHNLMQAIARVNRVFKDKEAGLVVDYIGIAEPLKKALKEYTDSDKKEVGIDTAQAIAVMLEKYEIVKQMFHGYNYIQKIKGSDKDRIYAIIEGMNHIFGTDLKNPGMKQDFMKFTIELAKSHGLCSATKEGKEIDFEVSYFKAVKASIVKLETDDLTKKKKLTFEEINARMKQMVSNSIVSEEVIDIFTPTGLKQPDLSIMSDEFLEEVRNMKLKNLAVELLKRLIDGRIKLAARKNLVQSEKFSEKLKRALLQYQNKAITNLEVIEALIKMAKDFDKMRKEGEILGLNEDEKAFYDALTKDVSVKDFMSDEILKQIAHELTESIRSSITVDWQVKESARANMRKNIKRLLKKYKYPPEQTKGAIDTVIRQVELMCNNENEYNGYEPYRYKPVTVHWSQVADK